MMTVVKGTTGSGKSELAEKLCLETGDERRYYLATMVVLDDAGNERIERHRRNRQGKGFITIEKPLHIEEALSEMEDAGNSTVLLECVANLVGNEMHGDDLRWGCCTLKEEQYESFADDVAAEIMRLSAKVKNLIAVTDSFPADGEGYDDETRTYVRLLDMVNERLMNRADRVIDVMAENREGNVKQ